jgi:hypothetical protein
MGGVLFLFTSAAPGTTQFIGTGLMVAPGALPGPGIPHRRRPRRASHFAGLKSAVQSRTRNTVSPDAETTSLVATGGGHS